MKKIIQKNILKPNLKVSKKNFQKNGKWITKPFQTNVIKCLCGNKYIATRKNQVSCVRCIYSEKTAPSIERFLQNKKI